MSDVTARHREIVNMFATMWIVWERNDPRKASRGPKYPLITPHEWRLNQLAVKLAKLESCEQVSSTERHREWIDMCACWLTGVGGVLPSVAQDWATFAESKLAKLEGDPPPDDELDIRCSNCGKQMDSVGEQHIDIPMGSADDPNSHTLCGVGVLVDPAPTEGLEDAVEGRIVNAYNDILDIERESDGTTIGPKAALDIYAVLRKYIVAAVQPLLDKLKKQHKQLQEDSAGLQEGYYNIVADNDKLKKQIEYQREIHESNQATFDKITNVLHEKIDTLKQQVEELQEEREGAYKHGYEDAGGSR